MRTEVNVVYCHENSHKNGLNGLLLSNFPIWFESTTCVCGLQRAFECFKEVWRKI